MKDNVESLTGHFSLADDRTVFGSLRLCGEDTKITLYDDAPFLPIPEAYEYLTCELHDGRFATLLDCVLEGCNSQQRISDRRKYSAWLFPHFVAIGRHHIPVSTCCISQISFSMKDASSVFYDFDAFSTVFDPTPFVPLLIDDKAKYRQVDIGKHPIISYFTGNIDVAVVDTILGEIKAHHQPTQTLGGPGGIGIFNKVFVTLTPTETLTFKDVIDRLATLLRFFELLVGREQSLFDFNVRLKDQDENSSAIEIHRTIAPDPDDSTPQESHAPGPRDVLISTCDDAEQYSLVLTSYMASDNDRRDSRSRLRDALNSRKYTIDRLIGAANLFEILPDSAYPTKAAISDELKAAKADAKKLFRSLENTIERNSILGAIGRIGELSLKHKVRHRVTVSELNVHFPQFVDVLDEAVNCRNHYVHGSPGKIDYSSNFELVCFFTAALEFAFGASDLIELGWDFSKWKTKGFSNPHPFGNFVLNYKDHLSRYNELFGPVT